MIRESFTPETGFVKKGTRILQRSGLLATIAGKNSVFGLTDSSIAGQS